jgi:hypothetical protein
MTQQRTIDFIGVGASRSGTTWLARCLSEHPDICIPRRKELQFFHDDYEYQRGIRHYISHFNKCHQTQKKGEFTPGYFVDHRVAERIAYHFPGTKILLLLRNPVDRAYSEYFYNRARGSDTDIDFEAAALHNALHSRYYQRGLYYHNLQPFLELFPRNQIGIFLYDDLENNPQQFLQEVFTFLEVGKTFQPETLTTYINTSPAHSNTLYVPWFNHAMQQARRVRNLPTIKPIGDAARAIGLTQLMRKAMRANYRHVGTHAEQKPPLAEGAREQLFRHFQNDIAALEQELNRDLSFWYPSSYRNDARKSNSTC